MALRIKRGLETKKKIAKNPQKYLFENRLRLGRERNKAEKKKIGSIKIARLLVKNAAPEKKPAHSQYLPFSKPSAAKNQKRIKNKTKRLSQATKVDKLMNVAFAKRKQTSTKAEADPKRDRTPQNKKPKNRNPMTKLTIFARTKKWMSCEAKGDKKSR